MRHCPSAIALPFLLATSSLLAWSCSNTDTPTGPSRAPLALTLRVTGCDALRPISVQVDGSQVAVIPVGQSEVTTNITPHDPFHFQVVLTGPDQSTLQMIPVSIFSSGTSSASSTRISIVTSCTGGPASVVVN